MIDKVNIENLRLAKVRYYDAEKKGLEITDLNAYAFIFASGSSYVNLFDMTDEIPVFERVPYTNTTQSGLNYGTKVRQLTGDRDKSGACYLLEKMNVKDLFQKDKISIEQIKDYMLHSSLFFVDRKDIIQEDYTFLEKIKFLPVILSDEKKQQQLQEYLFSQEKQHQYHK